MPSKVCSPDKTFSTRQPSDSTSHLGSEIISLSSVSRAVPSLLLRSFQNRDGIESVLLVSPFFGAHGQPVALIDGISAVLTRAPNFYCWWNEKEKEAMAGPSYAYPRFGTRCIAGTIELSRDVRDHLASHPLRASRIAILTSACDTGANSEQTNQLAAQWKQKNLGRVSIYEFPKALGVPHDMIDPNQPDAKTQITYPKILEILHVNPTGSAIE